MTEDYRIKNLYDDVLVNSGTTVAGQLLREDPDGSRHPIRCPECSADRELTVMQSGVVKCPAEHIWRVPGIEFPTGEAIRAHVRQHELRTGGTPRHSIYIQHDDPNVSVVTVAN